MFERILAMEDFPTFKKIMVKRNLQLQLEAIRAISSSHISEISEANDYSTLQESEVISSPAFNSEQLLNPDELESIKNAQLDTIEAYDINEDEVFFLLIFQ